MSDQPKRRRGGPSVFGELEDNPTAGDVAQSIFGESKTTRHLRAKPRDITKIRPDPLQPRRAVPSELRKAWGSDPTRVHLLFDAWLDRIENERGSELIWEDILNGKDSTRGNEAENLPVDKNPADALEDLTDPLVGPLESSFLRLVDLAASIKRDGLTNPITIAPIGEEGTSYIIETGERRWLAYHLLKMVEGVEQWGDIPARQVGEVSVWRQASENNARHDLNAISKARQLALLLMALHGWEHFQPMEEFDHEQEFYAQVSDGNTWRIPKNHGEQLLNAMGLSSASHLRRYRAILRVDSSIWDSADDADWTEREIRDKWKAFKERAKKRDRGHGKEVIEATHPSEELLAKRNLARKTVSDIAKIAHTATVGEVSAEQRAAAEMKIRELRAWLAEQEELIRNK